MILNDLLIGIVLSAAFPLGHLLYLWSKEEVDWVLDRYKFLKNFDKIILPFAVVSGLLAGFFVKNTGILLALFFANLIVASLSIRERKQIVLPAVLFLVVFFVAYFIANYWKGF